MPRHVLIGPLVEFVPVKGNALFTDRDGRDMGAHLGVEAVAIHAEIARRVTEPEKSRLKSRHVSCTALRENSPPGFPCGRGCFSVGCLQQVRACSNHCVPRIRWPGPMGCGAGGIGEEKALRGLLWVPGLRFAALPREPEVVGIDRADRASLDVRAFCRYHRETENGEWDHTALPNGLWTQLLGRGLSGFVLLRMRGDAMGERIPDGTPLLVDTSDTRIADDNGVYALLLGESIMVRRVQRRLQGDFLISCDNPSIATETIDRLGSCRDDDARETDVLVLGRVALAIQKL